ncbi:hypothetical protein DCAR_0933324 [Daucus carota subsp. sativus]|uniref:RING-type E3 ubiquitin transferase n=2 Tax=Daucus carota subsp. sativus TaxID=79200 RepID=A0AAF0XT81_DAUCS|nr:hypothetical protein DCAR_0933324 [Daucus carota subsp. sativus]
MFPTSPSPSPSPQKTRNSDISTILSAPSPSPSPFPSQIQSQSATSSQAVKFTPPLIAMVAIVATAFLLITYSRLLFRKFLHLRAKFRRYRRRRRLITSYNPSSAGDIAAESPPYISDHIENYQIFSPYGLDDSTIKTIPLTIYTRKSISHECAVCLLEFEESEYIRTLPVCNHTFHVDCIDIWLRSHANCPLCRTGIFRPSSPFIPVMASRIRPSLDEIILESTILETLTETPPHYDTTADEITVDLSEDRLIRRNFLLKRSYSFGFERNLGSERLLNEPAMTSPWRYRRSGGFWSTKRPSPFSTLTKHRVFSLRYYRGMKSPFFRQKGVSGLSGGSFPMSESRYGCGSSRRRKSFASPMFIRSSERRTVLSSSSESRLRSGDPEALLSPDRYNRR